jgi:hypothetical protein
MLHLMMTKKAQSLLEYALLPSSLQSLILAEYVPTLGTLNKIQRNKLRGLSPRANYTDRAPAACQRS